MLQVVRPSSSQSPSPSLPQTLLSQRPSSSPLTAAHLVLVGGGVGEEDGAELVVEHEHEGRADRADVVGEGALVEALEAVARNDVLGAAERGGEGRVDAAGHHHHRAADRVERVRTHGREDVDGERHEELGGKHGGRAGVGGHVGHDEGLGEVVETEVTGTVDDDAGDGRAVATVETADAVGLDGLLDAVKHAVVLAARAGSAARRGTVRAGVGSEASVRVLEGVRDSERGGTSGGTGGEETGEPAGEANLLAGADKHALVALLEGEIHGLGGEVTQAVSEVTAPEGGHALLLGDAGEGVHEAGVLGAVDGGALDLEENLHALEGCAGGLGDDARGSTKEKVLDEGESTRLLFGRHLRLRVYAHG